MESAPTPEDKSNGYEGCAEEFIRARDSQVGAATVRRWAQTLSPGSAILDLGCGNGIPVGRGLIDDGFFVYGIDASPRLIAEFQRNCPRARAECAAVEVSSFFGRQFQGVLAWGLIFLLTPVAQAALIEKISDSLEPGGRLLFTAPQEACTWNDALTGRLSRSLGEQKYREILESNGLDLVGEDSDEGENHYYLVLKQR